MFVVESSNTVGSILKFTLVGEVMDRGQWRRQHLGLKPLGALVLGAISVAASAQTCAFPEILQIPSPTGASRSANTCSGDAAGSVLMCGGTQDRVGPVYVFHSTFTASRTFTTITLSGGAAGFDAVMFMTPTSGGCGANQETCNPSGDTGVGIATGDVPNGDWLIFVTAFGQNAPGACGPITISTDGSFPVALMNFTVS